MNTVEPVMIMLDKERPLVLNFTALKKFERLINRERREDGLPESNIWNIINEAYKSGMFPAQVLINLIWAAISVDDPSLSVEDVGRLMHSPIDATKKVIEAISKHFPEPVPADDMEAADTSPLARPNGLSSGPLPASS